MASNINPYNIDGTFPVANQNNDSQGFRDNFTNIKNNLTFAQNEITDLQTNAILKSALTGQTLSNDMTGTVLRRPQLAAWTQSLLDLGAVATTATLSFNSANFQKVTTAAPITLEFIDWPATTGEGALGYGAMRVWIVVTSADHTVTLPTSVNVVVGDISGYNTTTRAIKFDAAGNYLFEFSSIDGGSSYLIQDLSRNRASFRDPALYYNPDVNSSFLIGFGSEIDSILALESGQNIVATKGSIASIAVGNLSLANNVDASIDTGYISGYSLVSTRGNLTANVFTPVQSGDYLGYYNAVTYTGYNNTANTFQQVASINFYATGSNVTYGLGGNIAFFTGRDGDAGVHTVSQAVGIENDQSTKFYGNVITGNVYVPSSNTAGGVTGQITYDRDYIYICLGPNNWKRASLGW
jgi:hypothetical protein